MAAGPGTDVRDAAVVLFTQTATERAHTWAHEQVSVGVCLLLRGYGVFLSFIRQNGSNSDRKTSRFARFTVVRLKNMNPSFTMLMLMGKIKNSLWSSSSGSRKWRSSVTFHLTGTSSAMTSSITVTTWLAVIRKCSLSSTNSQVRWIKGPNHQTLAIEGESSNDELIILSLLVYVSCTFVCSVVLFQVQHQ